MLTKTGALWLQQPHVGLNGGFVLTGIQGLHPVVCG